MLRAILAALVFVTSIAFAIESQAESDAFKYFRDRVEQGRKLSGDTDKWVYKEIEESNGLSTISVFNPTTGKTCTFLFDLATQSLGVLECHKEQPKLGI